MPNYVHSKPKRIALYAYAYALADVGEIVALVNALAIVWITLLLGWLLGGCSALSNFDGYRFEAPGAAAQVLDVDAGDGATLPELDAGDAATVPGTDAGDAAQVLDVDASDGATALDAGRDADNGEQCCLGWSCHAGCVAYWCGGACRSFPCAQGCL